MTNAHHPLWEPHKLSTATGRNLVDVILLDPSVGILTPPSLPTYYNIANRAFSTLELSFLSAHLLSVSQVTTEPDLGSDHYPMLVTVGLAPCVA